MSHKRDADEDHNTGGWFLSNAEHELDTQNGSGPRVRLYGLTSTPRLVSCASYKVDIHQAACQIEFSCQLLGLKVQQKLKITARASVDNNLVLYRPEVLFIQNKVWKTFRINCFVPAGVREIFFLIENLTASDVFIAKPEVKVFAAPQTTQILSRKVETQATGESLKVIQATYTACVRPLSEGLEGTITFPIPGPYRHQIPLTFELKSQPRTTLLDYSVEKRPDGTNWIAVARVKPPFRGAIVTWTSLVLTSSGVEIGGDIEQQTKCGNLSSWLKPTKCVQSDNLQIIEKSAALALDSTDLETYARRVIEFTSSGLPTQKKYYSLDAKTALELGGSCTSRANLASALLRANGIPARTVAHLPAWHIGPLFQHWLVEYWQPDVGWIQIEPTLNAFRPNPSNLVILAVSNPEDEDLSDDPIHRRYIAAGAAYLSGCELSSELEMARIIPDVIGPNTSHEIADVLGTRKELETLLNLSKNCVEILFNQTKATHSSGVRTKSIYNAAREGQANKLSSILQRHLK